MNKMRKNRREEQVKMLNRVLTGLILACLLMAAAAPAFADDSFSMAQDGFSTSYTYNYDYWRDVQMSPDAYRVKKVINSMTLGLENLDGLSMKNPESLFVRDNELYIADTENNRVLQIHCDGEDFSLVRIISEVKGCDNPALKKPYDIAVDADGNIYVADYGNFRVVMMDKDLNYVKEFVKPTDSTFDQKLDFLPRRIAVDVAGRVYVLAENINKGFIKYESDTSFTGYIGANKVSVDTWSYIWKRYFQTKEQRAASESFVPTEYENLYMDKEGFIYATNTVFSEYDLLYDNAKPIRRLNGIGNDILIKNDRYPPIGDMWWIEGSTANGPSKFTDITVLENDIYVALDKTRGRMFGYDSQGVMLWAFGTKGNIDGAFTNAASIEHMGYDLFVLDKLERSVTVFTPTEYGTMIFDAIDTYVRGNYDASADLWRDVMKMNANYSLAFRGIGRALVRQNKFKEAMSYFEKAHDPQNYGRAFKLYRKEWVEKNVWWIILILAAVLIVPLAIGRVKRMKWEVIEHERNKVRRIVG